MSEKKTPPADDYEIRCPRLGHQIYFSYCRRESRIPKLRARGLTWAQSGVILEELKKES